MMLSWLGEQRGVQKCVDAGREIELAIDEVMVDPAKRTADLGGSVPTDEFGSLVASQLAG